jgi:hypothetical protein
MSAGLWVAYELVGRPPPPPAPAADRESAFLPLTVRDPYRPTKVYMADRAPMGATMPPPRATFPPETKVVYCIYDLPRVRPDARIEATLRSGGTLLVQRLGEPLQGDWARGSVSFAAAPARPFAVGIYEVHLRLPGMTEPLADVAFDVVPSEATGKPRPAQSNISAHSFAVALGVDARGRPVSALPQFPQATRRLVLCFEYEAAEPGQVVTCEWLCEGEVIRSGTCDLELTASAGRAWAWIEAEAPVRLPTGKYRARVRDGDVTLGHAAFEIVP